MRSLLVLAIVLVLAATAVPPLASRLAELQTGAVERSRADEDRPRAARAQPARGREVAIRAARDGHFYVKAEINRRPVRLMVDTGASVVALRQSDAEAVGLRPRPADFREPVATANGTAYAARAELDRVSVRHIELLGVRALVLPDRQLGVSLLGGSFLNRLARFEVEGGTLVLED